MVRLLNVKMMTKLIHKQGIEAIFADIMAQLKKTLQIGKVSKIYLDQHFTLMAVFWN